MRIALALLFLLFPFLQYAQDKTFDQLIDQKFGEYTGWFVNAIFYTIPITEGVAIPWVLIVLIGGAVYFTLYFKLINITGFKTAINIVRGKYDKEESQGAKEISSAQKLHTVDGDLVDTIRVEHDEDHDGEVSHFQALTAALSATVGLGNIAGVAVAISLGGPGATFWMIVAGLIGMASKFTECTLGVRYREIDSKGRVFGGPMYYLKNGFRGLHKIHQAMY
jgi:AGCS family alanine or glycine:cation symporter